MHHFFKWEIIVQGPVQSISLYDRQMKLREIHPERSDKKKPLTIPFVLWEIFLQNPFGVSYCLNSFPARQGQNKREVINVEEDKQIKKKEDNKEL